MGGFTVIYLKDRSEENIRKHNELLKKHKVTKRYRFYSIDDIMFEYDSFKKNLGTFPEHLFPKDKIKTLDDFCRYWNPKAVGECFVPYTGSLSFDCYFGRTSKRAMRGIGKYIIENWKDILAVTGSFDTFIERGMTKSEMAFILEMINEGNIKETYKVESLYNSPYEKVY
jgi:hypothetical protein